MKSLGLAVGAALVVGLYGASTSEAAGGRVETQVKGKVSCPTTFADLQMSAFANNPTIGSANVEITTGNPNQNPPTTLLSWSSKQKGYGLNSICRREAKQVALTHRGLATAFVSRAGYITWRSANCSAPPRVLVRYVIGLDASGDPVKATIAVRTQPNARTGKKSKPIGYVQWTPTKSTLYARSACVIEQQ